MNVSRTKEDSGPGAAHDGARDASTMRRRARYPRIPLALQRRPPCGVRVFSAGLATLMAACITGDSEHAAPSTTAPPAAADGVPRTATALNPWLQHRPYASWPREASAHRSDGPHGGSVRAYLNASLDRSLATRAVEHPVGSAAVKELLTNGQASGWLVMVKTGDQSDAGKGWYWYEVTSTIPNASATAGNGTPACVECHRRGRDYVQTPHPLR